MRECVLQSLECPFKPGQTILFQGDSITDASRTESENPETDLGKGYVAQVRGLISALWPELPVNLVNRGVGGERSVELLGRWQEDCIDIRPDWLSIMVGVNDVGRKFWPYKDHTFVPAGRYGSNLRELIRRSRDAGIADIVVVSPTFAGKRREDEANILLDGHAAVAEETALAEGCIWIPARELLWRAKEANPGIDWLPDGCHPSPAGHAVIAASWLKGVLCADRP